MTQELTPAKAKVEAMLYQALAEPVGLLLVTDDVARCRQLLYQTRVKIGDPALARLQFRLVDMGQGPQVVIVKGAVLPQAPAYQPQANGTSPNLGELDL